MLPHRDVHCKNVRWSNGIWAPCSSADGAADESVSPQSGIRDPGFPVDLTVHGDIAVLIAIYLGYESWKDMVGCKKLRIEGDRRMAHQLPTLIRLDKLLGRDYRPLARQAERAS